MQKKTSGFLVILILIALGFVFFFNMNDEMEQMDSSGEMMEMNDGDAMDEMGSEGYQEYSEEALASVEGPVLFFHAVWCPTCKSLDNDIMANLSDIPSDVTILKVDYDSYTDLKKKYGVTTQHTLVQVDNEGNLINKWLGSPTLEALLAKVQ
ncbi:MAG: thioredoxin family protein [Candidatus Paceibacterota bacterium]